METYFVYVVLVLLGVIIGYLLARIYFMWKLRSARSMAVKQSRSVVMGQVSEQLAPILPDFPYHYKDVMFMGKGVDYVVFDGMHRGNIEKIVLMEVKTGNSILNKNEKMIRDCVIAGKVAYDVWRM